MRAMWQRARPVVYDGRSLLMFTPEDLLLAFCLRTTCVWVDRFLKSLYDLHRIVMATPLLDWDALRHEADRFAIRRAVYVPLAIIHEWFETPIPPAWLDALARASGIARQAARWFARHPAWFVCSHPRSPRRLPNLWLSSFLESDRVLDYFLYTWRKLWMPVGQLRWERNLYGAGMTATAYLGRFLPSSIRRAGRALGRPLG